MTKNRPSYNPERVECARWCSGSCGRLAAAGTTLLLWAATLAHGQGDTLIVRPSVELHYSAGVGQVFELQGSKDLQHWRHLGDAVIGEGQAVSDYLRSVGGPSAEFDFFRVKISTSREFGFAPRFLPGRQLDFNDEGEARRFAFTSRASGTAGGDRFAYNYHKLGDTSGRLTVEYGGGKTDQIELDFTADRVGTYTRTSLSDGVTKDVDKGTFSLGRDPHASPLPPAAIVPDSLQGHTYMFSDGDMHERLDFVSGASGRAIDRADVVHFGYDYTPRPGSGLATIHYPGDVVVEFEFRFGSRACGSYLRRELVDGTLENTSVGVFSCAASVYHTAGADSTDVTLPVDELTGRTYVMDDGGTPCRLQFQSHESGKCIRGRQVDEFTFDYVVNCNATSTITVHFADGDYDRYHLNHSDEIFERHEVRAGVETDTDSGTFSESL